MTPSAWATLQGQIVQARARNDWYIRDAGRHKTKHAVPRHDGADEAYADALDKMDFLLRLPVIPLADAWDGFRAYIRERDDKESARYRKLPDGKAPAEHTYGRCRAYAEVLAYMDSAEKEAGR